MYSKQTHGLILIHLADHTSDRIIRDFIINEHCKHVFSSKASHDIDLTRHRKVDSAFEGDMKALCGYIDICSCFPGRILCGLCSSLVDFLARFRLGQLQV